MNMILLWSCGLYLIFSDNVGIKRGVGRFIAECTMSAIFLIVITIISYIAHRNGYSNMVAVISLILAMALLAASVMGCTKKKADATDINIGVLVGPTGMGAVKLMDDAENGVYKNYHFTLTPDVTDIVAKLSNGDLDIGEQGDEQPDGRHSGSH